MINILNGGAHADNALDFQEFMIMPVGASNIRESIRMGVEVFQSLKINLKNKGHSTNVGDEGGFAPEIASSTEALELIMESIEACDLKPGEDIFICLDAASNEFFEDNQYNLTGEGRTLDAIGMAEYYESLIEQFPIISI